MCPKSFLALYHPVPGVKIAGTTQRKVSGKNSEGGPFRGTLHIRFRVAVHLFSIAITDDVKMCLKKKKTSGTQAAGECVTEIILQIFSEPRAMMKKAKKTSFPCRHPCICTLIDHGQRPITARVVFTSLYKRVFMAIIPIGVW